MAKNCRLIGGKNTEHNFRTKATFAKSRLKECRYTYTSKTIITSEHNVGLKQSVKVTEREREGKHVKNESMHRSWSCPHDLT